MHEFKYEERGGATDSIPVDNDKTMWLIGNQPVSFLMAKAKDKWPDVNFADINIEAVHHHQYCIYYDLHDSSDYVDYLVLSID